MQRDDEAPGLATDGFTHGIRSKAGAQRPPRQLGRRNAAQHTAAVPGDTANTLLYAPIPRIMPRSNATCPTCWLSSTRRCPMIQIPVRNPPRGCGYSCDRSASVA